MENKIIVNDNEVMIGKYVSADIIANIWDSYTQKLIKEQRWPKQCNDINKYLFEIDLAEIIGVPSIKNDLLELYSVLSKRITALYNQNKDSKIGSNSKICSSKTNYELLINGYEEIMGIAFDSDKKTLNIDFSKLTFTEIHNNGGIYNWDEKQNVKSTISKIGNENSKKLVKIIDKNI